MLALVHTRQKQDNWNCSSATAMAQTGGIRFGEPFILRQTLSWYTIHFTENGQKRFSKQWQLICWTKRQVSDLSGF